MRCTPSPGVSSLTSSDAARGRKRSRSQGSTSCLIPGRYVSSARRHSADNSKGKDGTMSEPGGERPIAQPHSRSAITRDRYDAVLLDMDGVITDTARLHAACWKQMFDEYLGVHPVSTGHGR